MNQKSFKKYTLGEFSELVLKELENSETIESLISWGSWGRGAEPEECSLDIYLDSEIVSFRQFLKQNNKWQYETVEFDLLSAEVRDKLSAIILMREI